ncbi:ParB/RepB/Spo0J family partition protein [Methylobacterium sp. C25]|uniref:ParB/RepB/Spo0J family partition protein n=1 Tax=Methylobacterium sp. C25 TaxID=2721622 RepID=UPI001F1D7464|nr:ParB/RepB/Spo0J family partition protein [Methylobacterium sp. C25]MCE4226324.1 ParB/RepB/Spo0J family partition protein [Methylobacterium sp. C25]
MSYARKVEGLSNLFEGLDDVAGAVAATGTPLEIALDAIEEDPNQPRIRFSELELAELAASIVERGVRQAITVTPRGEGGRHRILYGARRFRAAQRAGLSTIPAVIRASSPDDAYDQMIENIQRDDLTSAEIAAFVSRRMALGEKQVEIGRRLGKDRSFVAMHAAVAQMPDALRAMLETSPIRGVYELYQGWRSHPEPVLAFCRSRDQFTRAEANAFVESLKDTSAADPVSAASSGAARPFPSPIDLRAEHSPAHPRTIGAKRGLDRPGALASTPKAPGAEATVFVRVDQREGRLLLDRQADLGADHARVRYDDGAIAEVAVNDLRLVAVRDRRSS